MIYILAMKVVPTLEKLGGYVACLLMSFCALYIGPVPGITATFVLLVTDDMGKAARILFGSMASEAKSPHCREKGGQRGLCRSKTDGT